MVITDLPKPVLEGIRVFFDEKGVVVQASDTTMSKNVTKADYKKIENVCCSTS